MSLDDQQLQDLQALHKNGSGGTQVSIPVERLKLLEHEGLIRPVGEARFVLTRVGLSVLAPPCQESIAAELDKRLEAAGMIAVAEMLRGAPLDGFITHAGVHSPETFGQWLEMRRGEMLRLQAGYDLGDKPKGDELYEWVVSHSAVFAEVHVNFKAAMASTKPPAVVH
ncbi:hypothetical protein [Pseudomonas amygdali]|nr:hypothetical protein [Pseudomonas amygdali]